MTDYENYINHMNDMHTKIKDYSSYQCYADDADLVDMSPSDFNRYKNKEVLSEIQFWNSQVERKKIKLKMMKAASKSLNNLM